MRRLRLTEYELTAGVRLSTAERDTLKRLAPGLQVTPTLGATDEYDLTPGSEVGAVSVGDLAIEIRPKIEIGRFLFLLSYAIDPIRWKESDYEFAKDATIYEAIVPIFMMEARRALARGLLQGYIPVDDALQTVRGRVRISDQLRRRYDLALPVEVSFDDFTVDITENRLIRAAAHRLRRLEFRSRRSSRLVAELEGRLEQVSLIEYSPVSLPNVTFTRLNAHYRSAVELAKLILASASLELEGGRVRASAFLVDMNKVFETFVVTALREALDVGVTEFGPRQARRLWLDRDRGVRLVPDLTWWDGRKCIFVGDVKYKRSRVPSVPNADVYQLLAYAIATELPGGLLVYAAGEEDPATFLIDRVDKTLHVLALNLSGRPDEILRQVASIASVVRDLASETSPGWAAA